MPNQTEKGLHAIAKEPPTVPPPGQFQPATAEVASTEPATNGSDHASGAAAPHQKMPSLARQAWNLARSLADFVADGCKTVTREQYQARLEICDSCDHRRNNRCMKCGCRLSLKAQGRAFKCPAGKWPAVECEQEN